MRVTIAQVEVSPDRAANLAVVRQALAEAARLGSDLLVLPEYASAYDPAGSGIAQSEALDGPFVRLLRGATAQSGLTVLAGTVLPGEDVGAAYNAVVAVARGEITGVYRKVHLYDAFGHRESDRLQAGDPAAPPLVVDVAGTRVGVLTCYDLRFPESARRLVDDGAEVLVVPAAWAAGPGKVDQWQVLARARAIENTCVVVAVGQAGRGVCGHSLLVSPDGEVQMELDERSALRTADVDPSGIRTARERNPSLLNRRYRVVPQ